MCGVEENFGTNGEYEMNIKTYDAIVIGSGAAGERGTFHPNFATNAERTQ